MSKKESTHLTNNGVVTYIDSRLRVCKGEYAHRCHLEIVHGNGNTDWRRIVYPHTPGMMKDRLMTFANVEEAQKFAERVYSREVCSVNCTEARESSQIRATKSIPVKCNSDDIDGNESDIQHSVDTALPGESDSQCPVDIGQFDEPMSRKDALKLVTENGLSLQDVPVELRTHRVCIAAIMECPDAEAYIPTKGDLATRILHLVATVKRSQLAAEDEAETLLGERKSPRNNWGHISLPCYSAPFATMIENEYGIQLHEEQARTNSMDRGKVSGTLPPPNDAWVYGGQALRAYMNTRSIVARWGKAMRTEIDRQLHNLFTTHVMPAIAPSSFTRPKTKSANIPKGDSSEGNKWDNANSEWYTATFDELYGDILNEDRASEPRDPKVYMSTVEEHLKNQAKKKRDRRTLSRETTMSTREEQPVQDSHDTHMLPKTKMKPPVCPKTKSGLGIAGTATRSPAEEYCRHSDVVTVYGLYSNIKAEHGLCTICRTGD